MNTKQTKDNKGMGWACIDSPREMKMVYVAEGVSSSGEYNKDDAV